MQPTQRLRLPRTRAVKPPISAHLRQRNRRAQEPTRQARTTRRLFHNEGPRCAISNTNWGEISVRGVCGARATSGVHLRPSTATYRGDARACLRRAHAGHRYAEELGSSHPGQPSSPKPSACCDGGPPCVVPASPKREGGEVQIICKARWQSLAGRARCLVDCVRVHGEREASSSGTREMEVPLATLAIDVASSRLVSTTRFADSNQTVSCWRRRERLCAPRLLSHSGVHS